MRVLIVRVRVAEQELWQLRSWIKPTAPATHSEGPILLVDVEFSSNTIIGTLQTASLPAATIWAPGFQYASIGRNIHIGLLGDIPSRTKYALLEKSGEVYLHGERE